MTDDEIVRIFYPMDTCTPNQRHIALAVGRAVERVARREALEEAANVCDTLASEPFALMLDRNYEGEGISLWIWNGRNYTGSDGDRLDRDAGGTLCGHPVEWLTHFQLEQRLEADRDAARFVALIGAMVAEINGAELTPEQKRIRAAFQVGAATTLDIDSVRHTVDSVIAPGNPETRPLTDADRWRICEDVCSGWSEADVDQVGVQFRRPVGDFRSTSDEFRAAVDQYAANRYAPAKTDAGTTEATADYSGNYSAEGLPK